MSDNWDDNAASGAQSQVFTKSDGYGRSNWRDNNTQQRRYNDRSGGAPREDRRNDYRGGGNRGPRRSDQDDASATLIKVPSRFVGRIIGRGGSKINDLQFESGAKINVTKETDGEETVIKIFGNEDEVSKAESLIRDLTVDRERDNFSFRSERQEYK